MKSRLFRHDLHARFDVERYLHKEGEKLVKRFDAKCLVIGISSDDLFPVRETHEMVERMQKRGVNVTSFIVDSSYGHDAFLVEYQKMLAPLRAFMSQL